MMVIGILAIVLMGTVFSLTKAAGMADRKMEEIKRLTSKREAGGAYGN